MLVIASSSSSSTPPSRLLCTTASQICTTSSSSSTSPPNAEQRGGLGGGSDWRRTRGCRARSTSSGDDPISGVRRRGGLGIGSQRDGGRGRTQGGGGWEHELWRQPEGRRRCRDPELGVAGPGVSDQIRGGSGGIRQRQLMAEGQQLGRWLLGAMAARSERRRARTKGFERRWARAKQRKAAARGSSGYSANPGRRRLGLEQGSHGGGIDVEESLWGSGAAGRPTALGKKKENRGRVNRGVSGGSK